MATVGVKGLTHAMTTTSASRRLSDARITNHVSKAQVCLKFTDACFAIDSIQKIVSWSWSEMCSCCLKMDYHTVCT